jgi:hypothetical protein
MNNLTEIVISGSAQAEPGAGDQIPSFPTHTTQVVESALGREARVDKLPEAFRAKFFSSEGLTDKQLSKRILNNPIVDLCLRISTYSVGPGGNSCFDPGRRSGNRLYNMIGKHLDRGTYRRMLFSSPQQYKFVEECWIANMHTVLLNQDFNPVKYDRFLFRSIRKYKLWFLAFCFKGNFISLKDKDGNPYKRLNLINREKVLKALKNIAGIMQYSLGLDCRDHNHSPPNVDYWIGWDSNRKDLQLVWFGGHLRKWRYIIQEKFREFTPWTHGELSNLCQIRTFGRALPPPTRKMCRDAFVEQMQILTTEVNPPENVLNCVRDFSRAIGKKLGVREMPTHTHISMSISGCFEQAQSTGGLAVEISTWLEDFFLPINTIEVFAGDELSIPGLYSLTFEELILLDKDKYHFCDALGNLMFPRTKGFYLLHDQSQPLINILYGTKGSSARKRALDALLEENVPLPPDLGNIIMLKSMILASEQGYYISDIDGNKVTPEWILTIGNLKIPLYGSSQMRHHLIYVPEQVPKARLTCLAEPGAKTRPLGKNQAWFTMLMRAMRFMAEPILARDGRARIGLRSTNKMWSFLRFFQNGKYHYNDMFCQSTDYKSATDLIPLSLIEAMWEGFCFSLPKRHPFWTHYKLITCKRALYKDPKFKRFENRFPDSMLNQRGSFMGEPMSFLTLTLENLISEEITSYYHDVRSDIPVFSRVQIEPELLVGDPTCICGDDVAAIRRKLSKILLFREVISALCWELSWKDLISKKVLIFCEDHCVTKDTGNGLSLIYIDVIKSRLLTTMSREHSDNRSSILGKGRMLSNQLDYFEDKNLKIATIGYFSRIFDRSYGYEVIRQQGVTLPIYLPPSCGGAGIPVIDGLIPSFMYPYIGYVFTILDIQDFKERFLKLMQLASLNSRNKHGVQAVDRLNILAKELASYRRASDGLQDIVASTIYTEEFVETFLESKGVNIPSDPYTKKRDYEALVNEASMNGFVPFTLLADQVERILNFRDFLLKHKEREPRTFNGWVRDSRKFWKNALPKGQRNQFKKIGKERFTTIVDLDKKVTRSFSGFIFVLEDRFNLNLLNCGPSLRIHYNTQSVEKKKISSYG